MKKEVVKLLAFTKLSKKELNELIEIPRNPKMGDYALPCFSLAKKFKKNPKEIAIEIAGKIKLNKDFEKVESVGNYINFFVNKIKFVNEVIDKISKEGEKYGSSNAESVGKVLVEFSQPNTHKAFHVGHIRGTSLGESLCRIFEFSGDKVIRANYSGDTGMHVAAWLWGYLKHHKNEKLQEDESWFAKIYIDAVKKLQDNEKVREEIENINRKLESRKDKKLNKLWKETRKLSIKSWEKIYHELNTKFDVHFFESEVEKRAKTLSKELVKMGVAEKSEGAIIVDLEKYGLSVWVLLRKDGTVLYSAKDLALAEKKFKDYKINRSIIITDSAQDLHFMQLVKTLELVKFKQAKNYGHVSYGAIRLPWGKMSSRTGDNILYSDFKKQLEEYAVKEIEKRYNTELESTEIYDRALAVAIASMKYSMLKQDSNKNIIFDPKKSISFEGDTGPYLLYSYARALSILEKADYKKQKKFIVKEVNEYEKRLASELSRFPDVVKHSYRNLAPNLIANYSYELAKIFSEFYHNCPVIGSKEEQFRLKLVDVFSQTIKNSLCLLGIPVIREM